MPAYSLFQIDAFTNQVFGGNPAAIVPLSSWLEDSIMQSVAAENNLSETAYFVPEGKGFRLRWFTPTVEMDLCGHATLAAAYVLFEHLGYEGDKICFYTLSGELVVRRINHTLAMDFPSRPATKRELPKTIIEVLGAAPVWSGLSNNWLLRYDREEQVASLAPNFAQLSAVSNHNIIVTAPGDEEGIDFVSRFFAPHVGINEDPVTGSAHCTLTPYWAAELDKAILRARQISARSGILGCELNGERVTLSGHCKTFMEGRFIL